MGEGTRTRLLYLAPWMDIGGSDKGTLDWFRFLRRDRFRASLITTQPSRNRRLDELRPYAEEVWDLPQLLQGGAFPRFILDFIHSRGVRIVHVMNSRLGFELLPQIASLPDAPRLVVQLHVEELDRSGYVRYVTSRYGNLVDAFSVSSEALRDRLLEYDVPASKCHVIRTGVDAEREFSPAHARAIEALEPDCLHLLSPIRLTAQKDPLLTLDVLARLRKRGVVVRLHIVGEGEMLGEIERRIAELGLEREVRLHGAVTDVVPWYAACDVVLLTSVFEGVPYVAYEAMAMAKPLVAPALPGLVEIVTPSTGMLVAPREDVEAYVEPIVRLAADPLLRTQIGAAARARAASEFSLSAMAGAHAAVYDALLESAPAADSAIARVPRSVAPSPRRDAAFRRREPHGSPLVSVIVPCYNHGRYIPGCLRSIATQDYARIETIVVDNGSTDGETADALADVADERTAVVRIPVNAGPSGARNLAIEHARGRYVLPMDADNLLLPGAVGAMVEQLAVAGEQIGFIYPNYQFFGNRQDFYESPSYNLDALLQGNYCDTASLFDREVFDRGFRYPDLGLGFEDWEFVLELAEHGIFGEPARARTLLYRKHGFSRADLVDAARLASVEVVASRHGALFEPRRRGRLKGEWRPALSLIVLAPIREHTDAASRLVDAAAAQTCADFEIVVRSEREIWPTRLGARLRRAPSAGEDNPAQALADGMRTARGRWVAATYASGAELLAEPEAIEKLIRALVADPRLIALALASAEGQIPAFRVLDPKTVGEAELHTLCWEALGASAPPPDLRLPAAEPLETLARWFAWRGVAQWRQSTVRARRRPPSSGPGADVALGQRIDVRRRDRDLRAKAHPHLPGLPADVIWRVDPMPVWTPPQTRILCRHLEPSSGRFVFTNDPTPPPGLALHRVLGSIRALSFPGTLSLSSPSADPPRILVLGRDVALDAPELLGFVEQAPLPMFDPLLLARHAASGEDVLLQGPADPLIGEVENVRGIGYIEAYPIHPRLPPPEPTPFGLIGLVRGVDLVSRRHRYGIGRLPRGQLGGELGALLTHPASDCAAVAFTSDGLVSAGRARSRRRDGRLSDAIAWACAPLTWRGFSEPLPKLRSALRRGADAARFAVRGEPGPAAGDPEVSAFVLREPNERTIPLYSARHPVTGDQLLSNRASEPRAMGYGEIGLVGHLIATAPVTGSLEVRRLAVPWATKFGMGEEHDG